MATNGEGQPYDDSAGHSMPREAPHVVPMATYIYVYIDTQMNTYIYIYIYIYVYTCIYWLTYVHVFHHTEAHLMSQESIAFLLRLALQILILSRGVCACIFEG